MKLFLAILLLTTLISLGRAQPVMTPGGQIVPGHLQMCLNGVVNADGSIQAVPCGTLVTPMQVTVPGNATVQTVPSVTNPALSTVVPVYGRLGTIAPSPLLGSTVGRTGSPW
jgi:hypothetical protein